MIACTSALAPTSMPRVGSSRISSDGLRVEPLAEHYLLLVAARELGDSAGRPKACGSRAAGGTPSAVSRSGRRAHQSEPDRGSGARTGQRDVGRDRTAASRGRAAAGLPTGRRCPPPWLGEASGSTCSWRPPSVMVPDGGRLDAEQRQTDIRPAGADQARQIPAPRRAGRRNRRPRNTPARGQSPRTESSTLAVSAPAGAASNSPISRPTMSAMAIAGRHVGARPRRDVPAVAEHRDRRRRSRKFPPCGG